MTKEGIHKSWQKFLAPLAGAAVTALGVYATVAQQSYSHENDSKIAVMESRIENMELLRDDVKELSRNVYELIGEIRAKRSPKR
ncbi:MAG: hypothetical protein II207_03820 [Clostridia bacterium]|nr:hypothetical protein [Clostridia bacterium]